MTVYVMKVSGLKEKLECEWDVAYNYGQTVPDMKVFGEKGKHGDQGGLFMLMETAMREYG